LTENAFSRRLKDLFSFQRNPEIREIELLKLGRHFRISPDAKLVVGRNNKENEELRALGAEYDFILTSAADPGPTVLGLGDFPDISLELAAAVTAAYSDAEEGKTTTVRVIKGGTERMLMSRSPGKEEFKGYML